jgi:DNA modification methylase
MVLLNRIACMDCLEYLQQLPDNSVDLVVTDPPYNVSQKQNMSWMGREVRKDFGDWDYGFDPTPVLIELKRVLKPTGQIYVFCSTKQIPEYMALFEDGWFFRNLLVWSKTNPVPRLSKTNWLHANEYILYAINETVKLNKITFNFPSQVEMKNIFITPALQGKERIKRPEGGAFHPTQKPLEILKRLIAVSSRPGDAVLDPFMGTGSTAVAALETDRNFYGCELDVEYAKVARERLSQAFPKIYPSDIRKR